MSELTREKFTDRGDQCWAVKNEAGAAEFRVITSTSTPVAITLHSPDVARLPGGANGACDLLPGGRCWSGGSFTAGRDLYSAWVENRHDDEVIWGALESWHADRLGSKDA